MNVYHNKMVDHVYPFLADEWSFKVGVLSEYLTYEDTIAAIIEEVRTRTRLGENRYIRMTCLFMFDHATQDMAWGRKYPKMNFHDRDLAKLALKEANKAYKEVPHDGMLV